MNMISKTLFMAVLATLLISAVVYAEGEMMMDNTFDAVCKAAPLHDGVREITYDDFMKIRDAGDTYVLLDVLMPDTYTAGHIPGARNFPVNTITKRTADSVLNPEDKIIVYCGSFACGASTRAAHVLGELGYTVVDYKGGLKEWQEKGNDLET